MYDPETFARVGSLEFRLRTIKRLLEQGKVVQAHAIASETRP